MTNMTKLYDETSLKLMKAAEECSDYQSNRIEEIFNFASSAGFKRIGIAHCITFSREAQILCQFFSKGFDVFNVDCKYGRLSHKNLFGGKSSRVLCNPAGQAEFLNEKDTDLNISIGLCVGHDMIFSSKSQAPVSSLFTKDFTNNHDAAEAVAAVGRRLR